MGWGPRGAADGVAEQALELGQALVDGGEGALLQALDLRRARRHGRPAKPGPVRQAWVSACVTLASMT